MDAQIEAVTRYKKTNFSGTGEDRAYLLGFCRGDLNVKTHGRAIRARTSSTQPGMIELVTSPFVQPGPLRIYPRFSELVGFE
jgi:hypothetical protein